MKKRRALKSQQLIEFLLVVPFIVIILGIVTEYAYALNIDMTLSQGLKEATSSIYSSMKPNLTPSGISAAVTTNLKTYLSDNNVPVNAENNISVKYVSVGGDASSDAGHVAVFVASYTYIPAFSLPNTYFKILPNEFNFVASAAVPGAFLDSNNQYASGVDSTTLDKIWSTSADFSSLNSFDSSKKGIMKDSAGRANMLFLIPTTSPDGSIPVGSAYIIATFYGSLITDASGTYTLNTNDGEIYKCSSTICTDSGTAFFNYITSNSYNNIIFDHDNLISNYATQWAYNSSTSSTIAVDNNTDISGSSVDGILKRTLALFDSTNHSIGNYDNINVSSYNTAVSAGNTYTVGSYGSTVFVYVSGVDNLTNIESATPVSVNYDFTN